MFVSQARGLIVNNYRSILKPGKTGKDLELTRVVGGIGALPGQALAQPIMQVEESKNVMLLV